MEGWRSRRFDLLSKAKNTILHGNFTLFTRKKACIFLSWIPKPTSIDIDQKIRAIGKLPFPAIFRWRGEGKKREKKREKREKEREKKRKKKEKKKRKKRKKKGKEEKKEEEKIGRKTRKGDNEAYYSYQK